MYYSSLFEAIGTPKSKDRKLFARVVKLEVDVKNLITLFRLKKAGVEQSDEIMPLMIEGGLELKPEKLAALPYDEFVNELQKTQYWDAISGVTGPDMASLTTLESRLTRYYLESCNHFFRMYLRSQLYLLWTILSIKIMRSLTSGLSSGVKKLASDDNLIKDQLVVI